MVALSFVLKSVLRRMSKKTFYPSADRNKDPILQCLKKHIPPNTVGNILEISSGTGQHASFFAEHFPTLTFHTSEYAAKLFDSIKAYARELKTKNVKDPIYIDVTVPCETWGLVEKSFDFILNINMMHIAPYECTVGLFRNSSQLLRGGGLLITYGPYAHDGVITPQSNVDFDKGLRMQDPSWGLRDIKDLKALGEEVGLRLLVIYDLPSNNKCLVWSK